MKFRRLRFNYDFNTRVIPAISMFVEKFQEGRELSSDTPTVVEFLFASLSNSFPHRCSHSRGVIIILYDSIYSVPSKWSVSYAIFCNGIHILVEFM